MGAPVLHRSELNTRRRLDLPDTRERAYLRAYLFINSSSVGSPTLCSEYNARRSQYALWASFAFNVGTKSCNTCRRRSCRTGFAMQTAAPSAPGECELCDTKHSEKPSIRLSQDSKAILVLLRPKETKAREFVFEPTLDRKTLISRVRCECARAVKNSGVAKIRFHDLRHTALTRLVLGRADIRTVKEIAGHSSLKTTQRYPHSSDKLQQQAIENLSGNFGRYISTSDLGALAKTPVTITIQ
jgi:Phage integrase family